MKVVLGVTGSIAAYKACELVRLLVKRGDDVHVVMTEHARAFVTPLTFQTLSRNPVECDLFADPQDWKPGHISLAAAADLVVVAPATANVLAKMAHGLADDLLTATLLATRAPVFVAPAMNDGMWEHPATQENLATLRSRGVTVIEPAAGELACGTEGKGRMADPADIISAVKEGARDRRPL
jgi:phosphopantothenoylcysteine decarboxylase/phosphopantothenate--cysteine ligase